MKVIVHVVAGASQGRSVPVQSGERATFGSSDAADVCLEDPEMDGFHFALHCESSACEIRSLVKTQPVLVNGKPADQTQLNDGDEISAGQTRLAISIDRSLTEKTTVLETPSVEQERKPTIQELCETIELDDEGMELLTPEHSIGSFVQTLVANERFVDAVRLLAYAMPKPRAVQWAHEGIAKIGQKDRTVEDQNATQATGKWVAEAVETNRREALDAAEKLEFATAPACAAAAAGWSGGSMVGPDLDPIEPDGLLTARMASIAIQIAALEPADDAVNERYKQVIEMGQSMLAEHASADSP